MKIKEGGLTKGIAGSFGGNRKTPSESAIGNFDQLDVAFALINANLLALV